MLARIPYKWLVAAVYVLAIFMNLLDLTITNTALPVMARFRGFAGRHRVGGDELSAQRRGLHSGQRLDRRSVRHEASIRLRAAVFTLGSLLCGVVNGLGPLIVCRVFQGIGGGFLTPVGAAMVFRAFPLAERARVSALITIPAVVAPALGPVVGGAPSSIGRGMRFSSSMCPSA